jgi:hypothetical protein
VVESRRVYEATGPLSKIVASCSLSGHRGYRLTEVAPSFSLGSVPTGNKFPAPLPKFRTVYCLWGPLHPSVSPVTRPSSVKASGLTEARDAPTALLDVKFRGVQEIHLVTLHGRCSVPFTRGTLAISPTAISDSHRTIHDTHH